MKRKHKRLSFVALGMLLLASAVALVLTAISENIVYFRSPTEMLEMEFPPGRRLRIGGLVEEGSMVKADGAVVVKFRVTDLANAIPVTYEGLLPDLFREGQGVVAEGYLKNGVFAADEVLAKHDENYMPPEAAEALKKSGQWKKMEEALEQTGQIGEGGTK